jgi:1-aminocyclopropane-1-carboxylate deaminase/D-cysteine desulfhydrase-like pyridoxal-dependent ACC family enzyme
LARLIKPMDRKAFKADDLRDRITALPRQRLAVLPTGLQETPRFAAAAGIPKLFLKRDDLTGLALGGNKSRGLEFILGDAIAKGCDVLVAGGGVEQSNHAVQCVAAANKLGLDVVMVLRRREPKRSNGNALLHELLGGATVWVDADPEIRDRGSITSHMHRVAAELAASGSKPYVLESSLHPLSVIAYANALLELCDQLPNAPTRIYVTSEGAALGGLLLGIHLLQLDWSVRGLAWRPLDPEVPSRIAAAIEAAATLLAVEPPMLSRAIEIQETGGPAYGVGSSASWEALRLAARLEGLLLDPVYTAKGFGGLLADTASNPVSPGAQVVFVHTGGVAAMFAYEREIVRELRGAARCSERRREH